MGDQRAAYDRGRVPGITTRKGTPMKCVYIGCDQWGRWREQERGDSSPLMGSYCITHWIKYLHDLGMGDAITPELLYEFRTTPFVITDTLAVERVREIVERRSA